MFEAGWTPLQVCVSCFKHSSRSGWPFNRTWFTIWSSQRDSGQLLILEEGTPTTDVYVHPLQNSKWLNFFSNEKNVKIINFNLNQFAKWNFINLIFIEFSNINSILRQIKYAFLFFFFSFFFFKYIWNDLSRTLPLVFYSAMYAFALSDLSWYHLFHKAVLKSEGFLLHLFFSSRTRILGKDFWWINPLPPPPIFFLCLPFFFF